MSDPSSPSGDRDSAVSRTLTDRVLARVNEAGLVVDRREHTARRSSRHRRPDGDRLAASVTRTPEQIREARSLRRVFHELGDSYRDYRRRTGEPVSAEVRDAATRFRREISVPSLVSVAACLDQLEILSW
jgi:hypothetical protein